MDIREWRNRGQRLIAVFCGALLTCFLVGRAAAATKVDLTVFEREGVARVAEPIASGVPIPKGVLASADNVRLLRDGKEVPAQFRALGLWRPGTSIRWLLVDTQADLAAKGQAKFTLEYGDDVSAEAKPESPIRIAEADDAYTVDTGAAAFRISRRTFTLFDEVRLADGSVIVVRPEGADSRSGTEIRGLRPTVTRALPAGDNRGRAHLIYVTCSPNAKQEDYTLRFTSDRGYEIAGAESGSVGKGRYREDFRSADGAISIPADAWLQYAYPKAGDVYTFRAIPEGAVAASEGVFESAVVERGPLRSVIRLKGSFGPTAAPLMEFTAWYHFYAGSARVKLAFTLENNDHGGRTSTGNASNADIGGINCVFFDEMVLRLPLALGGERRVVVGGAADAKPLRTEAAQKVELYQDSSGGEHWDRYRNAKFHPRPDSYVGFRGYRIYAGGEQAGEGDRALGWLDVSDGAEGLTVSVRDFWQNFPKALAADADGVVEIGLFPGRYAGDFPFRSGEHKTHEVLFAFHPGPPGGAGNRHLAAGFSEPLRLEPSPAWYARTKALGYLHPYDIRDYPAYEIRNASAIGFFLNGAPKGPSLFSQRELHQFYGWMDYGDVPMDFEAPSGQWGMKYDMDYHMAQQYARTWSPQWWSLFAAAARHTADIDIHHQPHYPGLHFVKGGNWAHSAHSEPGHKNPHRNRNHFTKDLAFAARGTAALYHLTGNWKARAASLEVAENALAEYMSPQKHPGPPEKNNRMGWRGDACTLNRLLEGYLLSGEEKYLERARWQIASCAFDGKPARHGAISLWSSLFYMMALARYVEMFPDDAAARSYLLAHLDTLRNSIDPRHGIYYTITPQPDGSVQGKGNCSHYNIMAADALAIGYLHTRRMEFMDAARRCFAYGVKNACGEGGPPTYNQVHSANGALHGNVFMAVDSWLREQGGRG